MQIFCEECHRYLAEDPHIASNQTKTTYVVVLSTVTMIMEIVAGYATHSMALTAEGWHMASHAGAMLIAVIVYRLARSQKVSQSFSFGAGKLIPLGGYTSAVVLTIVAFIVIAESVGRFFAPEQIAFNEALGVACLGLCVNIASALILRHEDPFHHHRHHHDGHEHEHGHVQVHDHNLRSAFFHVVLDAVTAVLAIAALAIGKFYHATWVDPAVGVVGAALILVWAYQLLRDAGSELLDRHCPSVDHHKLRSLVEIDGVRILDCHVWRIAPKATACELVVSSPRALGHGHYRDLLQRHFSLQHVLIEERTGGVTQ